jgi:hypothetical protein
MFASSKSAFKPWVRTFNAYEVFINLLESGEITLANNNGTAMSPFEAVIFMEQIYIKNQNGTIKVVKRI